MAGKIKTTLLALALCAGAIAFAEAAIVLPSDNDEYAKLVARAQTGDQMVDFHALRFAYLTSAAHKRGCPLSFQAKLLQRDLIGAMNAGDDVRVHELGEKLISADYINMYGHKALRQACAHQHDDACAQREHFIEFGLLNSITHSGDGKTCATGWEVVSVGEEYFILDMMGAQLQLQSLVNGTPSCDAMTVTTDNGATVTYFFRIDAVLADEAGILSGNH